MYRSLRRGSSMAHIKDLNRENRRAVDRYIRKKLRQRFSEKTIKKIEQAIGHYLNSLEGKSFKKMNNDDFDKFMKYLETLTYKGKPISENTKINSISHIRRFLENLRECPGYRKSITRDFMDNWIISPGEKRSRKNRGKKNKPIPSKEDLRKIISLIVLMTIIGRRDRALLAYLFITGARISAAITMKLGLVDIEKKIVHQNYTSGVETKFGYDIETTIPNIYPELTAIFFDWVKELYELGFTALDPLFPKGKPAKKEGYSEFTKSTDLSHEMLSMTSAERIVKSCCRKAGFPEYHCHSFRDAHIYYAFKLARNGIEMKAISRNVGHLSLGTTDREYAGMTDEEVHDIMFNLKPTQGLNDIPKELFEKFWSVLKAIDKDQYDLYFSEPQPDNAVIVASEEGLDV